MKRDGQTFYFSSFDPNFAVNPTLTVTYENGATRTFKLKPSDVEPRPGHVVEGEGIVSVEIYEKDE